MPTIHIILNKKIKRQHYIKSPDMHPTTGTYLNGNTKTQIRSFSYIRNGIIHPILTVARWILRVRND